MSENLDLFNFIIGMSGAVLGSFLSYIFTRRWDRQKRKEERNEILDQMRNAFIKELELNRKLLRETARLTYKLAGKTVTVSMAYLASSVFDSSINSGYFYLLNNRIQTTIQGFYGIAKIANQVSFEFHQFDRLQRTEENERALLNLIDDVNDKHKTLNEMIDGIIVVLQNLEKLDEIPTDKNKK